MKRVGGNCVGVYLEYQYRIRPGTHRYHRLDMKSEPDSVRRRRLRLSSKYKTKFVLRRYISKAHFTQIFYFILVRTILSAVSYDQSRAIKITS